MSKKPAPLTKIERQLDHSNKWLGVALKRITELESEYYRLSVRLCVSCKEKNLCAIKTRLQSSRFCRHMDYDGIGCSEWELDDGPAELSDESGETT